MTDQLALGDSDFGRDDLVDVVIYDRWGRHIDTIPASLGQRDSDDRGDRWSLHAASLWAHLAVKRAEQLPPTWAQMPCHDDTSLTCAGPA